MNIKVLLIIILITYFLNEFIIEQFDELLVSTKEVDVENISIDKINELINLLEFIKLDINKPKYILDLPEELQNVDVYNNILYEMYIDDFLDNYLVNRLNINKYIKIKYNYIDNFDIIYKKIEELKKNLNNIDEFIFLKSSNNEIINLHKKMQNVEINEFKNFFKNDIKNYLDKVFINLGLNKFFIYSLKTLNNDNIVDVMDTLDLVIENEVNLFNNYVKK
jgi:hypothetical protein